MRHALAVGLAALLAAGSAGQEKTGPAANPPELFSKQAVVHSWTEGDFKGNSFAMDYRADGRVMWKHTVSEASALEKKYAYVALSPTLHQFSFKETGKRSDGAEPTDYFVVITYDTSGWETGKSGKVHGLVNKGDEIIVLKGTFKAGEVKAK